MECRARRGSRSAQEALVRAADPAARAGGSTGTSPVRGSTAPRLTTGEPGSGGPEGWILPGPREALSVVWGCTSMTPSALRCRQPRVPRPAQPVTQVSVACDARRVANDGGPAVPTGVQAERRGPISRRWRHSPSLHGRAWAGGGSARGLDAQHVGHGTAPAGRRGQVGGWVPHAQQHLRMSDQR